LLTPFSYNNFLVVADALTGMCHMKVYRVHIMSQLYAYRQSSRHQSTN